MWHFTWQVPKKGGLRRGKCTLQRQAISWAWFQCSVIPLYLNAVTYSSFSVCETGGEKCVRERPVLAERPVQTAPIGAKAPIWVHSVDAASASPPSPDMNVRNLVHMCQLFLWERKESWWGVMTCVWVCVYSVKQDSPQCFGPFLSAPKWTFFSLLHYLDDGDLSPL